MTVAAVPVPMRVTDCVVGLASSVKVKVAISAAVVEGVKVMLTTQEPLAPATDALLTHVVVPATTAKSAAFAPVMATAPEAARCKVSVPELVKVTVIGLEVVFFGTLPKGNGLGAAIAIGKIPVPVRFTTCCEPATALESSVMVKVAASPVEVEGLNVMLTTHVAFGARAVEFAHVEVPVMEKSAALAPPRAREFDDAKFNVSVPVFFRVTVIGALVVPLR